MSFSLQGKWTFTITASNYLNLLFALHKIILPNEQPKVLLKLQQSNKISKAQL